MRIWLPHDEGQTIGSEKGSYARFKRIYNISPADYLGPAAAGNSRALLLNDDEGMLIGLCLEHLAPMGIGVLAKVSHKDGSGLKKLSRVLIRYASLIAWQSPKSGRWE